MPPPKIKVEKGLYEKARDLAETSGYASVDEFVIHLIEARVNAQDDTDPEGEEEVRRRLRGLGYIS